MLPARLTLELSGTGGNATTIQSNRGVGFE